MTRTSLLTSPVNWLAMKFLRYTVGRDGTRNGELLRRASGVCDVFVTLDRNLEFQQNIKSLSFGIVVVRARSNRLIHLTPLVSGLLEAATKVRPSQVVKAG